MAAFAGPVDSDLGHQTSYQTISMLEAFCTCFGGFSDIPYLVVASEHICRSNRYATRIVTSAMRRLIGRVMPPVGSLWMSMIVEI